MILRRALDLSGFDAWLASVPGGRLADTSRIAYQREAESFLNYAGKRRRGWKRSQVEAWLGSRQMSASTATRALSALTKLAEFAKVPDPTVGIHRPKRDKSLPRPVEGLPFILNAMEEAGEHDLKWVCIFLASTGLRVSEACNENGCGFSLVEDALRVHGKGSKDRYVPLDESAKAAMAMLTPPHGSFRIPFSVKQIQAATREYGFHPHQLRHLFGTTTYTRTRDIYVVSRLMGHASTSTTQGYADISTDVIREAMNGHPAGKGRME